MGFGEVEEALVVSDAAGPVYFDSRGGGMEWVEEVVPRLGGWNGWDAEEGGGAGGEPRVAEGLSGG
jgi:hypothetical protein